MPLNINRETPQSKAPDESEQRPPDQIADREEAASGSISKIPQPDSTPTMKVQS
jgi:hypothetical protein